MVSTRCGEYTTPEKTPHSPPHNKDDDNSSNGGVGASSNYDDHSCSVNDNVGVDNEDNNSYHNNDDYDDDEEEMEAAPVRNTKRQHGTMMEEEEAGDEEDEEVEGINVRLSVKSKSKMSDEDLLIHFDNRFEKRASSICPNRQCDCLAILRNRKAGTWLGSKRKIPMNRTRLFLSGTDTRRYTGCREEGAQICLGYLTSTTARRTFRRWYEITFSALGVCNSFLTGAVKGMNEYDTPPGIHPCYLFTSLQGRQTTMQL